MTTVCPTFPGYVDDVIIRRVRDTFGWLGNMSPHSINFVASQYPTAEHLFQCMRFYHEHPARQEIRAIPSPMGAKMVAKRYLTQAVVVPRSTGDVDNMRFVLACKLACNPTLRDSLIATEDRNIIEDCSARATESGLFWGAAKQPDGTWRGHNTLGQLWMEIRMQFWVTP